MEYVIFFFLFVATAHAHTCASCDKSSCNTPPNCAGNMVYDVCKCCQVCAKQSNETCGGPFGIQGQCDFGMKCIIRPEHGDEITGEEIGTCKSSDSITESDRCQESDFDGCDVIDDGCTCDRRRACANPFQFLNKVQCTIHLLKLEETKTDCTNVGCIVRFSPKCPEDSELVDSIWPAGDCCPLPSLCECRPEKCRQQLCRPGYDRVLVQEANGKPGQCCDKYQCKPKKDQCDNVKCPSPYVNITCPGDSVKITDRMSKDGCCELPPKCECKSRICLASKCANGYTPIVIVKGNGKPGTCCDVIECVNATHGVCRVDGIEYKNGESYSLDACRECECKDGASHCHSKQCPELPDCEKRWTPPGKCCPRCKVVFQVRPTTIKPVRWCTVGRESHPPGDVWYPDPCMKCVCLEHGHECISESCQKNCENPRMVEGECCGVCDEPTYMTIPSTLSCPSMASCKLTGVECPFGFKSDYLGCRLCQCREKSEVCPSMAKCKLNCRRGYVINDIGCEKCKCARKSKTCRDMTSCSKECPFGFRKDNNGCNRCRCRRCKDVASTCDKNCKHGKQMNAYGCEICKCRSKSETARISSEIMRSRSCVDEELKRDDGESWVTSRGRQCVCRGGIILCDMLVCPVPHCDNPVIIDGFQCAFCANSPPRCPALRPDEVGTCSEDCSSDDECFGDEKCCSNGCGHVCKKPSYSGPFVGEQLSCGTRVEGESWMSDACTSCVCNDGSVMCTYEECKPAACSNSIYAEGHCCPTCQDEDVKIIPSEGNSTCIHQGASHEHGTSWKSEGCTNCKCDHGVVSCYGDKCPQNHNCMNPVIKRGQCCPQCLDDISIDTCTVFDREYSHGEEWAMPSDACASCTCVLGNIVCRREICRPVSSQCKQVMRKPGECCEVCVAFEGIVGEDTTPSDGGSDDKLTIIIAASVGGVILIVCVILAAIFFRRRSKRTKYHKGQLQKAGGIVTSQ